MSMEIIFAIAGLMALSSHFSDVDVRSAVPQGRAP